jgi:hypothetical protein
MDKFSASAALMVGAVLTVKAYGPEILAGLDRADAKLFDILKALKPYIYRKKHGGKKKARHRFSASKEWSYNHADGSRYVPDWKNKASTHAAT